MSDQQDDEADVEWRRPWGLYAVAALIVVVIAAGALLKLAGRQGSSDAAPASPTTSASTGNSPRTPPFPAVTVAPAPSPEATTHQAPRPFVHGIPRSWTLVGMSWARPSESGTLVTVRPGAGTMVNRPVPPLLTGGPVSLIAGTNRVLIHPTDREPSYVYEPGGRDRFDGGLLGSGGLALPGPKAGQVWVQDATDDALFHLMRLDGRRTGVQVRRPDDPSWVRAMPDGAGYLLVETPDGAYDVRPGERRRITKGSVVAAGATVWLARECPTSRPCHLSVIDAKTHERHTVPSPCPVRPAAAPSGTISPDGRTAALICGSTHGARVLYLLDLHSGKGSAVRVDPPESETSMVWAPRSAWLFVVTGSGRLTAISRSTGHTVAVGSGLPPLSQLAAARPTAPHHPASAHP